MVTLPKSIINLTPTNDQYQWTDSLKRAIEVAMRFNQPLLLTGEPGTGKTILAKALAKDLADQTKDAQKGELKFFDKPLKFNTKTTSAARDLFYIYDAVGHFQQANINKDNPQSNKSAENFITYQALGKAIIKANNDNISHVVLIDEIDKAPRDFTNDLLNEIENYEFEVKELENKPIKLEEDNPQRIVIIMTSNSEKNLPEAFLRRCVFFHIEFPSGDDMINILKSHLKKEELNQVETKNLKRIEPLFQKIRKEAVRKKPATAELVALVKLLDMEGILNTPDVEAEKFFKKNLNLIAKTTEDLKAFNKFIDNLPKE